MQTVTIDRDFTQPPERVFAYLAEHEHLEPAWTVSSQRCCDARRHAG